MTAGPERVGRCHAAALEAHVDFRAALKAEAFFPNEEQLVPGKHLGIPKAFGPSAAAVAGRRRCGSCWSCWASDRTFIDDSSLDHVCCWEVL